MISNGFQRCHDSKIIGNCLVLSNDYIACSNGKNPTQTAKLGVHWHNGGWLSENDRNKMQKSILERESLIENYFKE